MGYLFLSIALFAGATKGFCGKKMGGFAANTQSAVFLNLVRMLLCILFSVPLMLLTGEGVTLSFEPTVLLLSAMSGVSTSLFVVLWLLAVRKSAYMMLDVFLTLGTLLPMLCGWGFFGEEIRPIQWLGFGVLLCAVLLLCSYNNQIKQKINLSSLLLLVACGLANGATDLSQKMFVRLLPAHAPSLFNLYTYVFAALTLGACYLLFFAKGELRFDGDARAKCRIYPMIAVMALALLLNSYFKTLAAARLNAVYMYPLNQGAALAISTLMATFFFGERPNLRCILGILVAFAGLLIINLN